jgi:hypothetical protein
MASASVCPSGATTGAIASRSLIAAKAGSLERSRVFAKRAVLMSQYSKLTLVLAVSKQLSD